MATFIDIFIHLALPLSLLIWVRFNKAKNLVHWSLISVLALSYLVVVSCKFLGLGADKKLIFSIAGLYVVFFSWGLWKKRKLPLWVSPSGKFSQFAYPSWLFFLAIAVVYCGTMIFPEIFPRYYPKNDVVVLEFPLKNGDFTIYNGGGGYLLNHHNFVKPQHYALDIVQTISEGQTSIIPESKDITQYKIFGAPIHAPCDGVVVDTRNHILDREAQFMGTDTETTAGNYVLLYCQNVTVKMGHIKKGTVKVNVGDKVSTGQILGQVGNTGNTTEPHLHLQVMRGLVKNDKDSENAQGIPVLYNGKYFPIRFDVIKN